MSGKPTALRLADDRPTSVNDDLYQWAIDAEDELRRLVAENEALRAERDHSEHDLEESDALRERLSSLLKATAIAIRGAEPELTSWSWHDLPERAARLHALNAELVEALRVAVEAMKVSLPISGLPEDQRAHSRALAAAFKVEGKV